MKLSQWGLVALSCLLLACSSEKSDDKGGKPTNETIKDLGAETNQFTATREVPEIDVENFLKSRYTFGCSTPGTYSPIYQLDPAIKVGASSVVSFQHTSSFRTKHLAFQDVVTAVPNQQKFAYAQYVQQIQLSDYQGPTVLQNPYAWTTCQAKADNKGEECSSEGWEKNVHPDFLKKLAEDSEQMNSLCTWDINSIETASNRYFEGAYQTREGRTVPAVMRSSMISSIFRCPETTNPLHGKKMLFTSKHVFSNSVISTELNFCGGITLSYVETYFSTVSPEAQPDRVYYSMKMTTEPAAYRP